MSLLLEMFTYPFIVRAFVVGVLVSLCAALLGVPLVLKRYSMIGDGLSHVSFGALAIALACGWSPLPVSIPVVILAALGLLRLTEIWCAMNGVPAIVIFEGGQSELLANVVAQIYAHLLQHPSRDPVGLAVYVELRYMTASLMLGEWFE